MKNYTLFFLLCAGVTANAQTIFPDSIITAKTGDHQLAKGTAVYLIPPPQFTALKELPGFGQESAVASIAVIEYPARLGNADMEFSKERITDRGVELLFKKKVTVNGAPGLYVEMKQAREGLVFNKNILIISSGNNKVYLVQATWCKKVEDKEADILAALKTVFIDPSIKQNAGEMPFTIDMAGTKVKYATTITKMADIYTSDGKYPPEDKVETVVVIELASESVDSGFRETFAKTRNLHPHGAPINKYKLKSLKPVTINGLSGFELISFDYYLESGRKARAYYQVYLFNERKAYVLSGYARKEIDTNIALFQAAFKSFRLK